MSDTSLKGALTKDFTAIVDRDLSNLDADKAAVAALAQGAVNVENFTIPLYLCSMASIQGTHKINNSLTAGRLWAGMSTTPTPLGTTLTPNQQAYNTIFSVFIQEMLHLQLAANLAATLGVTPKFFTGSLLENTNGGWGCYGPTNTTIPHIIDLSDTTNFANSKVNIGELNQEQINLFLAIEQSHEAAVADIKSDKLDKYFPAVPFANWTSSNTESDLPLFGTIGWMYNCLLKYLTIEYTDGKLLWEKMFDASNIEKQRDVFNAATKYHQAEYPNMFTKISAKDPIPALFQALDIVIGICDQGEGSSTHWIEGIAQHLKIKFNYTDNNVSPAFQPDKAALQADYPDSGDADARATGDQLDHWERFNSLTDLITQDGFMTFKQWFAAGNVWTGDDLKTSDYTPNPSLPTPEDVANALNGLKSTSQTLLNSLIVGAINGINSALTNSWGDSAEAFPNQAMRASGDRMSLYWAVMGAAPDLSKGLPAAPQDEDIYHACQGLSLKNPGNNCAAISAFHTCSGSNLHKGQGGCGYPKTNSSGNLIAPSDNSCAQQGGCGAPISAWQLNSQGGTMDIINIDNGDSIPPDTLTMTEGGTVYDAAWAAYAAIYEHENPTKKVTKPETNDLRIVIPPN